MSAFDLPGPEVERVVDDALGEALEYFALGALQYEDAGIIARFVTRFLFEARRDFGVRRVVRAAVRACCLTAFGELRCVDPDELAEILADRLELAANLPRFG